MRLVFVSEDAPQSGSPVPVEERVAEPDPDRIAQMLADSAAVVGRAVRGRGTRERTGSHAGRRHFAGPSSGDKARERRAEAVTNTYVRSPFGIPWKG